MPISLTHQNDIAVVTIDNPPVNATSQAVRQGLLDAVRQTERDPSVKAVLLTCAGRTFVAGADIREFGKPPVEPHLPDVLRAIEAAEKPWIAALRGSVLGGGLELAMACRYRVASPETRLGLPEVNLGLIPGAGGTVQLPRLVSAELALEMISGGKPITADAALGSGLIDAIADGALVPFGLSFIAGLDGRAPRPSTLENPVNMPVDRAAFDDRIARIIARAKGQKSPVAAARTLENSLNLTVAEALARERKAFLALKADPQSAALRYIFFAERGTTGLERLKDQTTRPIRTVGVVGGGTMGAGIAAACLLRGLPVVLVERDEGSAQAGLSRVSGVLDGSLARKLISQEQYDAMLGSLVISTEYAAFASADLVIEAVFEDFEVKMDVFARIETAVRPDAIIATNTSYLDVTALAQSLRYPSRALGLHFFSPAHIMKLLEIVVPDTVSDEVLASCVAFGKRLGKTCVLAGVCDGFIANRIMSAYRCECEYMLEDGALPWEIDRAMVAFGMPMGIFQMQDLAGLDISWAMRKRQAPTRDLNQRYVEIADKLCEMGRFGQKTGRGWYVYDGKSRTPDPEVEALILAEADRKGIHRTTFDEEQIMARILGRMQSEGRAILNEDIALRAEDIDVVMINAFGFPRWRGGPMYMAAKAGTHL